MIQPRSLLVVAMILIAALIRLVPYLPGVGYAYSYLWFFQPMTAICLFGAANLTQSRWAYAVPLTAMLLSDAVIGFYSTMPVVYGCFAITVSLGFLLRKPRSPMYSAAAIGGAGLLGETIFFLVTNFADWELGSTYAHDVSGLLQCYSMGIPFFVQKLIGTGMYSAILFGAFAIATARLPMLQPSAVSAHES